jgi:hypothetical protein
MLAYLDASLSRRIVETLDASGAVSVAVRAATLAEARAALDRGEAFAVVGIPPGTERDVLKGTTVHVPIYADATYMFIFRTTGIDPQNGNIHLESREAVDEISEPHPRASGSPGKFDFRVRRMQIGLVRWIRRQNEVLRTNCNPSQVRGPHGRQRGASSRPIQQLALRLAARPSLPL